MTNTRTVEQQTVEHRIEEHVEHQCAICEQWVGDDEAVPIGVGTAAGDAYRPAEQRQAVQAVCPYCAEEVFDVKPDTHSRVSVVREAVGTSAIPDANAILRLAMFATLLLGVVTIGALFIDVLLDVLFGPAPSEGTVPLLVGVAI